jgi:outer membrane protein assembly factor BamB
VKDYERQFTSPLELAGNRIYAGSANGSFYALSSVNGDEIWKTETQTLCDAALWFRIGRSTSAVMMSALRAVETRSRSGYLEIPGGRQSRRQPAIDERLCVFWRWRRICLFDRRVEPAS